MRILTGVHLGASSAWLWIALAGTALSGPEVCNGDDYPRAKRSNRSQLKPGRDFVFVCQDAGAGGYEAFPDVCRIADDRLIVAFYAGYGHVSTPNEKLPSGGRIVAAYSADEGATWSRPQTLYDGPLDDRDSSVTQLTDGRIACTFFTYPDGTARVTYSSDGGETWSDPQTIIAAYATSSPIRELRSGRLIAPHYRSISFSDDHGATWKFREIDGPKRQLTEADVIERTDGTLLAVHRGDGKVPLHVTLSTDQGETWNAPEPLSIFGHCPYLYRADPETIVLGYREVLPEDRYATSMRISRDDGRTWGEPIRIDDLLGAYPSLVRLKDGSSLVVYYEEGASSDLRARRFRVTADGVEWLTWDRGG